MFFLLPWKLEPTNIHGRSWLTANVLLIVANIVVFLIGGYWPVSQHRPFANVLLYGFSHAGLWHLVANMWAFWIFGNPVNQRLGNNLYLSVYLGTIVMLGLLARWWIPLPVVGSSGALFAVIALAAFLEPATVLHFVGVALFPLTAIIGLFAPPQRTREWLFRFETLKLPMLSCLAVIPLMLIWEICWGGWNWATTAHLIGLVCGVLALLALPTSICIGGLFSAEP